jgi:reverse gyrase
MITERSTKIMKNLIENLEELGEYDFKKYEDVDREELRKKVGKYRMAKCSTQPWYNTQRWIRHFR